MLIVNKLLQFFIKLCTKSNNCSKLGTIFCTQSYLRYIYIEKSVLRRYPYAKIQPLFLAAMVETGSRCMRAIYYSYLCVSRNTYHLSSHNLRRAHSCHLHRGCHLLSFGMDLGDLKSCLLLYGEAVFITSFDTLSIAYFLKIIHNTT